MMEILASIQLTKKIPLEKLFQRDQLQTFLAECSSLIGAPSMIVAASQFSKRYSSYLFSSSLFTLFTSGKFPALQMDQDYIEFDDQNGDFQVMIHDNAMEVGSNPCTKPEIDRYIQHYFAGHLTPLWTSISLLTGMKMDLLWENTYIYVAWTCLNRLKTPDAFANFMYLTQEADGSLFGLSKNPFTTFSPNTTRKKCCFYFMLPNASGLKCKNCPIDCKK